MDLICGYTAAGAELRLQILATAAAMVFAP